MKCAVIHSGQFFNDTISFAELGLSFAKKVLLNTSCATVLTVLTRWNNEPHLRNERDWFDVIINMPPPKPCGKENLGLCHVRGVFPMIHLGIVTAKHWGAEYIFRIRTDMLVEKFMLPTAFDDRCVYSHNKYFDNIFQKTVLMNSCLLF